jgi:hypothetical protein
MHAVLDHACPKLPRRLLRLNLKCKLKFTLELAPGESVERDVTEWKRGEPVDLASLGLSTEEGKTIPAGIQTQMVTLEVEGDGQARGVIRAYRKFHLFVAFEHVGTGRKADASGSRSLRSRNHRHYVAGSVVETNIHYPTDSNLLGDGVRVLIRAMKRIAEIAGGQGAKLRDRSRSVKFRILEIGRVVRSRGGPNRERLQQGYKKLLSVVGRVVGQAKRF